ncbi:hypothetical protein FALCPG4_015892 [Fusarium falciforme]
MFLTTLALLGAASASAPHIAMRSVAFETLKGVMERQVHECKDVPPPVTCERSCGPGYVQCVYEFNCYNPSIGQSCCSNGKYCPADTYCTDIGCCPDDVSLEECGATRILSVIPPPATEEPSSSSHPETYHRATSI